MHGCEDVVGVKFLKHQLPARRLAEQLDDVGGLGHSWAGSTMTVKEILDLADVLALLDKVLIGVDLHLGKSGKRFIDALSVVIIIISWGR